jgi:Holliday junction resolvase
MGKTSQRKGRGGELELARVLQAYGFPDVQPGEALNYGSEPDLVGLPGVHIECKRSEKLHISEWMLQAERDSERFGDGAPVVFHRRNREKWHVTLRLEDFMALYNTAKGEPNGRLGKDQN